MHSQLTTGGRAVQPPSSNTGAQAVGGVSDLVDYAGLSITETESPEVWRPLLGDLDYQELDKGGLGYGSCREYGGIRVYYDGRPGMGTHLQVKGQGCRRLEAEGVVKDWSDWASLALSLGAVPSRCDVARDDRAGLLDLDELGAAWRSHAVTSRWQRLKFYDVSDKDGQDYGRTLHFGSGQSDAQLRIYDKAAELANHAEDREAFLAEHGHHVRVELQLRNDRAAAAFRALAAGGLGFLPGVLRGYLDFKVCPTPGHDATRVATLPAWEAFLSAASKIVLATEAVLRTVETVAACLEHQWGPMLATLVTAWGGDVSWLHDMVRSGRVRMRRRHFDLLARHGGSG